MKVSPAERASNLAFIPLAVYLSLSTALIAEFIQDYSLWIVTCFFNTILAVVLYFYVLWRWALNNI